MAFFLMILAWARTGMQKLPTRCPTGNRWMAVIRKQGGSHDCHEERKTVHRGTGPSKGIPVLQVPFP